MSGDRKKKIFLKIFWLLSYRNYNRMVHWDGDVSHCERQKQPTVMTQNTILSVKNECDEEGISNNGDASENWEYLLNKNSGESFGNNQVNRQTRPDGQSRRDA